MRVKRPDGGGKAAHPGVLSTGLPLRGWEVPQGASGNQCRAHLRVSHCRERELTSHQSDIKGHSQGAGNSWALWPIMWALAAEETQTARIRAPPPKGVMFVGNSFCHRCRREEMKS